MASLLVTLYCTILFIPQIVIPDITYYDLNVTLRALLKTEFDKTPIHNAIGSITRVAFHDCIGPKEYYFEDDYYTTAICDGCIDFNKSANAGIWDLAVNHLEKMYARRDYDWEDKLSRADFWAAASTIAIQYAAELDNKERNNATSYYAENDTLPFLPFYIGRKDCSAAPEIDYANYRHPIKAFPDGVAGWDFNAGFFRDNLGFTDKEFVAVLGAHTLGRVHNKYSGFGTGPWVTDWDLLNNKFYTDLLDPYGSTDDNIGFPDRDHFKNWTSELTRNHTDLYEWTNYPQHFFVMLNADMSLVKYIDPFINDEKSGNCTCKYHDCPNNNYSYQYVQEYSNDNQLWLNDFHHVFKKMILSGYDESDLTMLVPDDYVPTTTSTSTSSSTSKGETTAYTTSDNGGVTSDIPTETKDTVTTKSVSGTDEGYSDGGKGGDGKDETVTIIIVAVIVVIVIGIFGAAGVYLCKRGRAKKQDEYIQMSY